MKSSKVKRSTFKSKRRSINKKKIRNTTKRKVSRRNSRKKRKYTTKKKKRKSKKKMKGGGPDDTKLIDVLTTEISEIYALLNTHCPQFFEVYENIYKNKIEEKQQTYTQRTSPLIKDETKDGIKQISYLTKDDIFYTKQKPSDYYYWWLGKYNANQTFIETLKLQQGPKTKIDTLFLENPESCLAWDVYEELKYYLINLLTSILNSYLKYKRTLTEKEKTELVALFKHFDECLLNKQYYYFTELHLKYIDWYRIAILKESDTLYNTYNKYVKCEEDYTIETFEKLLEFDSKDHPKLVTAKKATLYDLISSEEKTIEQINKLPNAISIYKQQILKPMEFTLPLSYSINVEKSIKLFAAPIAFFITKHTRVHNESAHPCYQIYHDLATDISEGVNDGGGHYTQYYFREDNNFMVLYFKKVSNFLDNIFKYIKTREGIAVFSSFIEHRIELKLTDIYYNFLFTINHEIINLINLLVISELPEVTIENYRTYFDTQFRKLNLFKKIIYVVDYYYDIFKSDDAYYININTRNNPKPIIIDSTHSKFNSFTEFLALLKTEAKKFNEDYETEKEKIE